MHVYEKNLLALKEKNPLLAFQLLTAQPKKISQCSARFPKSEVKVLYTWGIGGEKWAIEALKWVDSNLSRQLVILEDSPNDFRTFLEKKYAEKVVKHPQVTLATEPLEEVLKPFVWSHLYEPWECQASSYIKTRLADLILGIELTVCLYRDFGIPQLMNVFSNLTASQKIQTGESLWGRFKNIPAVICGAGPSLEKSMDTLKTLENHALIFGGGSALLPLSTYQVPVHFAVALDPEPPRERFLKQSYFEVPLFYQNSVSHSLFMHSQGPKLCLGQMGSFPLEKELGIDLKPYDVGWNVATFATQIAYQLGCDPIIFVGMDLCVYPEKEYAGQMEELRENPIECVDRFGSMVRTRPDFLMAKKWLEAFAQSHTNCNFLNASEAGLELGGIPYTNLDLKQTPFDLKSKIHQAVVEAPFLDVSQVPDKLQAIYQSINRCYELLGSAREKELDLELFYQEHLLPNWEVWKHFLQKEEIIREMESPEIEKKLQKTIFLKEVTQSFRREYERKLSI